MVLACLGSGAANLVMGLVFLGYPSLGHPVIFLACLFSVSNFFQSFGTLAVVKINAAWYGPSERGVFGGVFNIVVTTGYFLALGAGSSIISSVGFAWVFVIPGGVLLVMAIAVALLVKDVPPAALTEAAVSKHEKALLSRSGDAAADDVVERGNDDKRPLLAGAAADKAGKNSDAAETPSDLAASEASEGAKGATGAAATRANSSSVSSMKRNMVALLSNPVFMNFAVAVFCIGWVRDGLVNWVLSFMNHYHAMDGGHIDGAALVAGGITIGGILGGYLCGWVSDVCFGGRRIPPLVIFSAGQVGALLLLWYAGAQYGPVVVAVSVLLVALFVLGNYNLLSLTLPQDLGPDLAASAAGLLTFVQYSASGASGFAVASLVEHYGYAGWLWSLVAFSLFGAAATLVGSFITRRMQQRRPLTAVLVDSEDSSPSTTTTYGTAGNVGSTAGSPDNVVRQERTPSDPVDVSPGSPQYYDRAFVVGVVGEAPQLSVSASYRSADGSWGAGPSYEPEFSISAPGLTRRL